MNGLNTATRPQVPLHWLTCVRSKEIANRRRFASGESATNRGAVAETLLRKSTRLSIAGLLHGRLVTELIWHSSVLVQTVPILIGLEGSLQNSTSVVRSAVCGVGRCTIIHGTSAGGRTTDWFQGKGDAVNYKEEEWYELLREADRIDGMITDCWNVMGETDRNHRVKLVVDEWGTWFKPGSEVNNTHLLGQQSTIRDAVLAGLTLDTFHRHAEKIGMAAIAQLVNCLQALVPRPRRQVCADADLPRVRYVCGASREDVVKNSVLFAAAELHAKRSASNDSRVEWFGVDGRQTLGADSDKS